MLEPPTTCVFGLNHLQRTRRLDDNPKVFRVYLNYFFFRHASLSLKTANWQQVMNTTTVAQLRQRYYEICGLTELLTLVLRSLYRIMYTGNMKKSLFPFLKLRSFFLRCFTVEKLSTKLHVKEEKYTQVTWWNNQDAPRALEPKLTFEDRYLRSRSFAFRTKYQASAM